MVSPAKWMILALCVIAAGQFWLAYQLRQLQPITVDAIVAKTPNTDYPSRADSPAPNVDYVAQLAALQQSINGMQQQLETLTPADADSSMALPSKTPASKAIDAEQIAYFDRQLASLLPYGPVSDLQLAAFQDRLHELPPEQRFAMASALARAINNGQISPQHHPR